MKFNCSICNEELNKTNTKVSCVFCGIIEDASWICSKNHFICEECWIADYDEIVLTVCKNSTSKNPFEIANLIMHHPTFREYGIEHHLVVAPSIITALINDNQIDVPFVRIKSAIKRAIDIPYGTCGSRGDCGASTGTGIAISIITRATYKSKEERVLVLKATGKALIDLAVKTGSRCCKESVYSAIESAVEFLNSERIINYPLPNFECEFKGLTDCKKEQCNYYGK